MTSIVKCTIAGAVAGAAIGATLGTKIIQNEFTQQYSNVLNLPGRADGNSYDICKYNALGHFEQFDCIEKVITVNVSTPSWWGNDICTQMMECVSLREFAPILPITAAGAGAIVGGTMGAICGIVRSIFC